MTEKTLYIVLILASVAKYGLACNGYEIKPNYIRNCNTKSIVKLENFTLALDKGCYLVPTGCIKITKAFKTAEVRFVAEKPPLAKIDRTVDGCEFLINMKNQNLSRHRGCPFSDSRICASSTTKFSIDRYKGFLSYVAGTATLHTNVTHDSGMSCFEASVKIQKVKE